MVLLAKGPKLKIFYASDIHGSERVFRKFLNAGAFYQADALIFGGDLTGKAIVPFVENTAGHFTADIFGVLHEIESGPALVELEQFVRDRGSYPYRTTPEEMVALQASKDLVAQTFTRVMAKTAEDWVTLADERLRKAGIPCVMMPGNDDEHEVKKVLAQGDWIQDGEDRVIDVRGFQVASFGWATTTPWHSPREVTEEIMSQRLSDLTSLLDPNIPTIFNMHDPPAGSGLDLAYKMTSDMKVEMAGGQAMLASVGSTAVRDCILKNKPVLSLHGHIHESRGSAKVGSTLAVNAGSAYTEGVLQGTIISLRGSKVTGYQLVTG
ncbi:MAG: metallophosphoesterase [Microbacteriaceae bacterium]|nr:MAG: metallophosphoesterase [Microbacteriaceae bacterium]